MEEFLVSFVALMLVRPHTGGIHQRTYLGCFIHTTLFFVMVIVLSRYLGSITVVNIFLFAYLIDIVIVPLPSEKRGEYAPKALRREKILALGGLTPVI